MELVKTALGFALLLSGFAVGQIVGKKFLGTTA